ncbi:putative porin [Caulobacter soli]|uniref:putative porin n=1 Tax=Caulobacter soli TaxID=2708539 RepID=UPI0013EB0A33|nr:putative porin [Caulobacter soli]
MSSTSAHKGRVLALALLSATALSGLAHAQDASSLPSQGGPSQNATINLIRALVKKKVLTAAEAEAMIAQAQAEADQARAVAQAAQSANAAAATAQASAAGAVAAVSPASAQPGTSVRYVPQFVRDQIKDEVRAEVLADAKTQGLVAPDAVPEWVRGIKITGDLRGRYEGRFFDNGNALDFVNIGAINAGSPYNTDPGTNPNNPPILNSRKDRTYFRIRARIGVEAAIDPDITAYVRIATGSQNNPVSTNQTLGGYFSNKDLWLDRAYVDYRPVDGAHVLVGRMANPFQAAELVWDEDVNLDGVAGSYARKFGGAFSAFAVAGAFPLDYVADDGPKTALSSIKTDSDKDKWIFAGQLGGAWSADDSLKISLSAAYYDYSGVTGALSPSCSNIADYCLTDYSRPGFAQRGNTLFALRDITTTDPTNTASPQYYGLASKFRVLDVSGAIDWDLADDLRLNLAGHYARNLAYDRSEVLARGFNPASGLSQIANNNETCSVDLSGGVCPAGKSVFKSGDTAWMVKASIGTAALEAAGDWSLSASYRHIEPDALLDAFTDSDFHLGGTNAEGWTLGGSYGLRRHTFVGARWISSQEISGPPFKVDLMQVDLNVKF